MTVTTALGTMFDTVLDRAIVPGYSRIGYLLRSRHWDDEPRPGALRGKAVLVTGAGRGLGATTAVRLAELGARVHLVVRSMDKAERTLARIAEAVPSAEAQVEVCDVSDLDQVTEFAAEFRQRVPELHALIHNAGVMPAERATTAQRHETALATHVLGPFVLTRALREPLSAAAPGRVIFVASGGMYPQRLRVDDPEFREGEYNGTTAYARTKRMQVVLTELFAEHIPAADVVVHAMHPGWANTPGVAESMPLFNRIVGPLLRDDEQGADTIVWLTATARVDHSSGQFWHDRATRPTHYVPWTRENAEQRAKLWQLCLDAEAGR
ncbi:SDR family NAD(P)-dependent oxidoreductase [Haloechinothrix halophila]|uniref:SDR family NAD(P)-dependent oxidoreductase n=1 Tax=Haloechinothrix halophila TaxID=1069073 RepID=UPI000422ACED|nr:SDR family NAD(P)-dependent oxidoreductase [Haloechinothrix halophila]